MRDRAIVLVSGGLDSCVAAAIASQIHPMAFMHVTYGQRTALRELKAFNEIADFYRIDQRKVIEHLSLGQIGGSSLTDPTLEIPAPDLESSAIPSTYVPFRNAHLIACAVSWGEVIGAGTIYIGAVAEDSSGYPDCRLEFYEQYNKLIAVGTKPETRIEIVTPIIHMKKHEIVTRGIELEAPLDLTWSCYKNNDAACGNCESCVLRLRGFEQAGLKDPVAYE